MTEYVSADVLKPNIGSGGSEQDLQPKLSYRFMVEFIGMGDDSLTDSSKKITGLVQNVSLPDFQHEAITIDAYVSRYYVMGKHSFGNLQVDFKNDASNIVAAMIQKQIDRQYNARTNSHSPSAGDAKFMTIVYMLDGSNKPRILEKMLFVGCWFTNVNWGSYNYGSSDIVNISTTMQIDNFYHSVSSKGGTYVKGGFQSLDKKAGIADSSVISINPVMSSGNAT